MNHQSYRTVLFGISIFFIVSVNAALANPHQVTFDNFDEAILDYIPPLVPGMSEENHELWAVRLAETYEQARRDGSFNIANYWNMIKAFQSMGADHELARLSFLRATEVDPDGWLNYLEELPHDFEQLFPLEYAGFMAAQPTSAQVTLTEDTSAIADGQTLDPDLVGLIITIGERDRQYRKKEGFLDNPDLVAAQRRLDGFNIAQIDSLYRSHDCYLGMALVGKAHSSTMWAVVQHSNVEMMERYLPIIQDAVARGDLSTVPLKMLIDRIYDIRTGRQIFGSQTGVKIADAETVAKVKRKYGL